MQSQAKPTACSELALWQAKELRSLSHQLRPSQPKVCPDPWVFLSCFLHATDTPSRLPSCSITQIFVSRFLDSPSLLVFTWGMAELKDPKLYPLSWPLAFWFGLMYSFKFFYAACISIKSLVGVLKSKKKKKKKRWASAKTLGWSDNVNSQAHRRHRRDGEDARKTVEGVPGHQGSARGLGGSKNLTTQTHQACTRPLEF